MNIINAIKRIRIPIGSALMFTVANGLVQSALYLIRNSNVCEFSITPQILIISGNALYLLSFLYSKCENENKEEKYDIEQPSPMGETVLASQFLSPTQQHSFQPPAPAPFISIEQSLPTEFRPIGPNFEQYRETQQTREQEIEHAMRSTSKF
jgi:hypothetical protein